MHRLGIADDVSVGHDLAILGQDQTGADGLAELTEPLDLGLHGHDAGSDVVRDRLDIEPRQVLRTGCDNLDA